MSAPATAAPYAAAVEERGFGASHRLLIEEAAGARRVLDVGCSSGYLAAVLAGRGAEVTGFERDPQAAAAAESHCERVIVGDLESPEDRELIPSGFEVVLLGDVLEHLADPWGALRFLRTRLAPGGAVVASIPNVAAWPVRLALLRGAFEYTDAGLLDRTHLRFFTRVSAHALVRNAGFAVERERFTPVERRPGLLRRALPRATDVVVKALVRAWPGLMAQQFVLRLRPAGGAD